MIVAITGATGFIGPRLLHALLEHGHCVRVLNRKAPEKLPPGVASHVWDPVAGPPPSEALRGVDAVIHLAGEPVAQRWTEEVKRRIRESRVIGTRNLVAGIAALDSRPGVLACSSATGFYGNRADTPLDESSKPGDGFLADVCVEWEREAAQARPLGLRVVSVRTGIVLHPEGGALRKMLPPFRMGVGGRLGSGRQWMPWIHLDDLIAIYLFAINHPVDEPLNGSSPNPVTNRDFTGALGQALHRPAFLPVPRAALKLLFGEMADVLFDSQRALPKHTEDSGFRFRFPKLDAALADLLKGP